MIKEVRDKIAVVTGGASGIGKAAAKCFLEAGMQVAIAGRRREALDAAMAELNGGDRLIGIRCDVADPEANVTLAKEVNARFGGINLVHLNAGVSRLRLLPEVSVEEWRYQMNVNLDGPFYGFKAFLPFLEAEPEAHIVITASTYSLITGPFCAAYYTNRAAMLSFAECLYFDLQMLKSHIGVSVVLPGNTKTDMPANNTTDDQDPELLAMVTAEVAKGTPPSVVADGILAAVRSGDLYVIPNPGDHFDLIDERYERIKARRNPVLDPTLI